MPRIAAKLDTSQVSDIIKVESADTFVRPIYAGNAFATVKSTDAKKCITIRPTSFEPCESSGGSAPIETAEAGEEFSLTKFVKSCLLYTSPSPRDGLLSRMPSSA